MKNNIFGKVLKELRIEKHLSQRELGDILCVANQTVSFWESGAREPDMDMILNISNYFGVSIDYLFGKDF